MKKAMLLASLAGLCLSGNALALRANDGQVHPVVVGGLTAGSITITAIGSTRFPAPTTCPPGAFCMQAPSCQYLLRWSAAPPPTFGAPPPFGVPLGNFVPCVVNEVATTTSAGCFFDKMSNIAAMVTGGPSLFGGPPTFCAGYDNFGISHQGDDVALMLSEVPDMDKIFDPFPIGNPLVKGPGPCAQNTILLVGTVCFPDGFMAAQSITILNC